MTSTGSSSTTATGISPILAIFWPMKPIMGGLVQIKSDTIVTLMGRIPNSDWTALKLSTADPQQSSQISPCLMTPVSMSRARVLMLRFQKKKETRLVFNVNDSSTSKTWV